MKAYSDEKLKEKNDRYECVANGLSPFSVLGNAEMNWNRNDRTPTGMPVETIAFRANPRRLAGHLCKFLGKQRHVNGVPFNFSSLDPSTQTRPETDVHTKKHAFVPV